MPSKVWGEITYPFPNVNGCTDEVRVWVSNLIPHFIMDVNFLSTVVLKLTMLINGAPGGTWQCFIQGYIYKKIYKKNYTKIYKNTQKATFVVTPLHRYESFLLSYSPWPFQRQSAWWRHKIENLSISLCFCVGQLRGASKFSLLLD